MRDLAEYFLPYQMRWIRNDSAIVIGEKARRIGWTYAGAFRAVARRLMLGTDLFFSSADLTAAREFIEDCHRWARVFRVVATDLGQQSIDESGGLLAFVLRFENGAKVVAGSSNPKFFRSKGGDADADEFAFHAQPRELYKAMQPSALIWGHQMRLWSTHNGEQSFFNDLVKGAQPDLALGEDDVALRLPTGPDAPVTGQRPRVQRVTLLDAVGQGLVERIRGLDRPDPVARRDFVAEIRASCPDEDAWNEEYLCQPSSEQSSLLGYELIAGCEAANLKLWGVGGGEVGRSGETHPLPPTSPHPTALYAG